MYYYMQGENVRGPLPLAQLKQMAIAGSIDARVLVRPASADEWLPLLNHMKGRNGASGSLMMPTVIAIVGLVLGFVIGHRIAQVEVAEAAQEFAEKKTKYVERIQVLSNQKRDLSYRNNELANLNKEQADRCQFLGEQIQRKWIQLRKFRVEKEARAQIDIEKQAASTLKVLKWACNQLDENSMAVIEDLYRSSMIDTLLIWEDIERLLE